jgi:MEDS: MEthanogen/methylotroph, DcmR Sensory domain
VATNDSSIRCADGSLGGHRHVCAFFNDLDEEHRVLRSFFKDGFDRGEKATHIVEVDKRADYLRRLAAADINVREMMDAGQLEVLPWTDMYVRDHRFDQDAMLASVEELIQSGATAGYPRTRLVGHHMDWLFLDQPAVNNLLQYEARLNGVLSKYNAPVICNYDLSKISASVAMDIMRTHPLVIVGGLLRENPFFVPPDEFLLEIRGRRLPRSQGIAT